MKARKIPVLVDVIQLPELTEENTEDYDEEVNIKGATTGVKVKLGLDK